MLILCYINRGANNEKRFNINFNLTRLSIQVTDHDVSSVSFSLSRWELFIEVRWRNDDDDEDDNNHDDDFSFFIVRKQIY